MREDKYRAMYNGKWIYFTIDDLCLINPKSMTDEELEIREHDRNTRCKYTRLKDKTGKEIYEGDIVEDYRNELFVINYNDGCFNFNSNRISKEIIQQGSIEVIGNIYENPELLEST